MNVGLAHAKREARLEGITEQEAMDGAAYAPGTLAVPTSGRDPRLR
jgi:hypothetical protein